MTQKQLAEMLGVSPQMISKWINGHTGLKVSTAVRWSAILNIDFKTLVTAPPDKITRSKLIGFERGKIGKNYQLSK